MVIGYSSFPKRPLDDSSTEESLNGIRDILKEINRRLKYERSGLTPYQLAEEQSSPLPSGIDGNLTSTRDPISQSPDISDQIKWLDCQESDYFARGGGSRGNGGSSKYSSTR